MTPRVVYILISNILKLCSKPGLLEIGKEISRRGDHEHQETDFHCQCDHDCRNFQGANESLIREIFAPCGVFAASNTEIIC